MTGPRPRRAVARRRRRLRGVGVLVGAAVVFAVGIALGESLHDNPSPGGTQTLVRTLLPLQVAPAARTTVTVTSP
ncbi:MAG TPA: hypothetical protein VHC45_06915 [Gaiellaceae bacterium]|nr:hypothetical protein [Gaiellaceae bacterium]